MRGNTLDLMGIEQLSPLKHSRNMFSKTSESARSFLKIKKMKNTIHSKYFQNTPSKKELTSPIPKCRKKKIKHINIQKRKNNCFINDEDSDATLESGSRKSRKVVKKISSTVLDIKDKIDPNLKEDLKNQVNQIFRKIDNFSLSSNHQSLSLKNNFYHENQSEGHFSNERHGALLRLKKEIAEIRSQLDKKKEEMKKQYSKKKRKNKAVEKVPDSGPKIVIQDNEEKSFSSDSAKSITSNPKLPASPNKFAIRKYLKKEETKDISKKPIEDPNSFKPQTAHESNKSKMMLKIPFSPGKKPQSANPNPETPKIIILTEEITRLIQNHKRKNPLLKFDDDFVNYMYRTIENDLNFTSAMSTDRSHDLERSPKTPASQFQTLNTLDSLQGTPSNRNSKYSASPKSYPKSTAIFTSRSLIPSQSDKKKNKKINYEDTSHYKKLLQKNQTMAKKLKLIQFKNKVQGNEFTRNYGYYSLKVNNTELSQFTHKGSNNQTTFHLPLDKVKKDDDGPESQERLKNYSSRAINKFLKKDSMMEPLCGDENFSRSTTNFRMKSQNNLLEVFRPNTTQEESQTPSHVSSSKKLNKLKQIENKKFLDKIISKCVDFQIDSIKKSKQIASESEKIEQIFHSMDEASQVLSKDVSGKIRNMRTQMTTGEYYKELVDYKQSQLQNHKKFVLSDTMARFVEEESKQFLGSREKIDKVLRRLFREKKKKPGLFLKPIHFKAYLDRVVSQALNYNRTITAHYS